jgi:hypothetical protein
MEFKNIRKGMTLKLRNDFPLRGNIGKETNFVIAVGNAIDGKFIEVQWTEPCTHKKSKFWVECRDVDSCQISGYHDFDRLKGSE